MIPPQTFFLGQEEGKWPIYAYQHEVHAVQWMKQHGGGQRRIWRVTLAEAIEMKLVPPSEPKLVEIEEGEET